MRVPSVVIISAAAIALAGGALVAQPPRSAPPQESQAPQPPARQPEQGRGRGPGGGRGPQGTPIEEGQECPPGTTEFRHLRCAAPVQPPPTIVDYRPRSTVVAEEHLVPRAKFPVVDVHTHGTASYVNNPVRI